jgi:hypothetical protein
MSRGLPLLLLVVVLSSCSSDAPDQLGRLQDTVHTQADFFVCRHVLELDTVTRWIGNQPLGVFAQIDLIEQISNDLSGEASLFYSVGDETMGNLAGGLGLAAVHLHSLLQANGPDVQQGIARVKEASDKIKKRTLEGCTLVNAA